MPLDDFAWSGKWMLSNLNLSRRCSSFFKLSSENLVVVGGVWCVVCGVIG